jgi:hypothetical protein
MTGMAPDPGITIFSGRFGSGKTEAAIGFARRLAQAPRRAAERGTECGLPVLGSSSAYWVTLVDLDIVTPYFRSRETAEALRERGVFVIAPDAVGRHLDIPAITPQILGAIQDARRPTVLDVGGDRQGARALGQFSHAIAQRGYAMYFVVNPFRPFTGTAEGVASSISEIETGARLRVTGLVSNPNLMHETTPEQILDGHGAVEGFAARLGLPVLWLCLEREWAARFEPGRFSQPVLVLDRFMSHPWEARAVAPQGSPARAEEVVP